MTGWRDRTDLATVTSDGYELGSLVMLRSFLRHNPWFRGTIYVICAEPSEAARAMLSCVPNLRFRSCSDALSARVTALASQHPKLRGREARFLSLDAFGIPGDGKLLFVDSDLLFLGDIGDMIESDAALVACPDGAAVRGMARDAVTLTEVPRGEGALLHSFNAGLMAIDPSLRCGTDHAALLQRVSPELWARLATDHTDQAVLNLHFHARVTLASVRNNLMLLHRADSMRHEAMRFDEARVLHFNGPGKPWLPQRMPRAIARDPAVARALGLWYEAFVEALSWRQLAQAHDAG